MRLLCLLAASLRDGGCVAVARLHPQVCRGSPSVRCACGVDLFCAGGGVNFPPHIGATFSTGNPLVNRSFREFEFEEVDVAYYISTAQGCSLQRSVFICILLLRRPRCGRTEPRAL